MLKPRIHALLLVAALASSCNSEPGAAKPGADEASDLTEEELELAELARRPLAGLPPPIVPEEEEDEPTEDVEGDEPPASPPPTFDLSPLVPKRAFLYLQVPALSELLACIHELHAAGYPLCDEDQGYEALCRRWKQAGFPLDKVDPEKPVGFALSLPEGGRDPRWTLIVAVADESTFLPKLKRPPADPPSLARGGFVGISQVPGYRAATAGNDIARDMPPGWASLRLDFAHAVAARGEIDALLAGPHAAFSGERPRTAAGAQLAAQVSIALDVLRAAGGIRTVEAALSNKGRFVELDCRLVFARSVAPRRSPLPRGILEGFALEGRGDEALFAAAHLPDTFAQDVLAPLLASAAPADSSSPAFATEVARTLLSACTLCGPTFAVRADIRAKGTRAAVLLESPQPQLLQGGVSALLVSRASWLDSVVRPSVLQGDGPVAEWWLGRARAEPLAASALPASMVPPRRAAGGPALFEGERVPLRIASRGRRSVLALGGEETWFRRLLDGGGPRPGEVRASLPPDMTWSLDRIGEESVGCVLRVDLGKLAVQARQLARHPAGGVGGGGLVEVWKPAPVALYVCAEGDTLRAGLYADLSRVRESLALPDRPGRPANGAHSRTSCFLSR